MAGKGPFSWSYFDPASELKGDTWLALENAIGATQIRRAVELKIVGGLPKGTHRVAVPLYDEEGKVRSAALIDPKGKHEPTRLANADTGCPDGLPLWGSSTGTMPRADGTAMQPLQAALEQAAGDDLHVTLDPLHLLTMVGVPLTRKPCLYPANDAAMSRLVEIIDSADPWRRPARVIHHFPETRYAAELAKLRDGLSDGTKIPIERVKTPREVEEELKTQVVTEGEMYLLYNGRVAVWQGSDGTKRGVWIEAVKTVAPQILMERGWKRKAAKAAIDFLPTAVDWTFDPRSTARVVERDGRRLLNHYNGLPLKAKTGPFGVISQLVDHLVDNDLDARNHVLDWIAAPLQDLYAGRGAHRNLGALVFHGSQGTGKGFLTEVLREIYGVYLMVIGQGNLEDTFEPKRMARLLMLIADEVTSSSNRDDATMNRLKSWITEPRLSIRRMGQEADEEPIHFNLIFTSNDKRPVRIEPGDRRYSVFWQDRKLPRDLVMKLKAQKEVEQWSEVPHFLAHLLSRPITRNLAEPFDNNSRRRIQDSSLDSSVVFARALRDIGIRTLSRAWIEIRKTRMRQAGDPTPDPKAYRRDDATHRAFVHLDVLSEIYKGWCASHGYQHQKASGILTQAIIEHIPETERASGRIDGEYGRGIAGIPIDETDPRSHALHPSEGRQIVDEKVDWHGAGAKSPPKQPAPVQDSMGFLDDQRRGGKPN